MTNSSSKINRRSFLFLGGAALTKRLSLLDLPAVAQPVQVSKSKIGSIGFYRVVVDLTDPKSLITMGLVNNAAQANTNKRSNGDEEFSRMMARQGQI
ncbi:hypothetical protein NIES2101_03440 [Calothrix sp. HK-06]|nr:hypothetical protein NIES2101_03440 [Calothrix sp. HK-06]